MWFDVAGTYLEFVVVNVVCKMCKLFHRKENLYDMSFYWEVLRNFLFHGFLKLLKLLILCKFVDEK